MNQSNQSNPQSYFLSAIEEARRPTDILLFMITLATLLAILIVISVLTSNLVLWITLAVVILSLVLVRIDQIWLLNNAIALDGSNYTYLDDIIKEICQNLDVHNVHTFAVRDTKDPVFVIGHFKYFSIVFDAEFMEVLSEDEARAMLVREIAQVKYKSAELNSFVRPLAEKLSILGLGSLIGWMFGFWSRKTEETANRLALLYTRNPHTLIKALVVSKMGRKYSELLDEKGLLTQNQFSKGPMRWFASTISYESFMTVQAKEILEYAIEQNIPITEETKNLLTAQR